MRRMIFAVFVAASLHSGVIAQGAKPAPVDDGFPKVKPKTLDAKVKSPEARVAACKAVGDLGAAGKPQRRALCVAMLDANPAVQVAAMDAMKLVDAEMHQQCVKIQVDQDLRTVTQVSLVGDASAPLLPLVMNLATAHLRLSAGKSEFDAQGFHRVINICTQALVKIDPADETVNRLVLTMLTNPSPALCSVALGQVPLIESKKLALPRVLALAANSDDRIAAIRTVPGLTDEKTKAAAIKVIEAMRYDKSPAVREAAAEALKTLE